MLTALFDHKALHIFCLTHRLAACCQQALFWIGAGPIAETREIIRAVFCRAVELYPIKRNGFVLKRRASPCAPQSGAAVDRGRSIRAGRRRRGRLRRRAGPACSRSNRDSPVLGQHTTASPSIIADLARSTASAARMRGSRSVQSWPRRENRRALRPSRRAMRR
jgi:hypothetical protein